MDERVLTISEAAASLGRSVRTLREWEKIGRLPEHLFPERNEHGDRRYSEDLVEHIREWAIAEDMRSGRNIDDARRLAALA